MAGDDTSVPNDTLTRRPIFQASAVLLIVCLILAYHSFCLFTGLVYYSGDIMHQHFPNLVFMREAIGRGEFPLWNPYQFGGMPFLADTTSQMLYPPLWFVLAFPFEPQIALMAYILFHYFLTATAMYGLMRQLDVGYWPAILSAVSWAFCGFFLLQTSDLLLFCSAAWIPLVAYMAARSARVPTVRTGIALGLCSAVQLLAGGTQVWLGTSYLVGVYWMVTWLQQRPFRSEMTHAARRLVAVLLGVAVGLATAAMLVMPARELADESVRQGGLPYQVASTYSLAPERLLSVIVPYVFGPVGWPEVVEVGDGRLGHVGVVPVALSLVSLAVGVRNPHVRFFAAVSVIASFVALGRYSFLHPVLYSWLPGYDMFRAPVRYLVYCAFCVSVLAGFGLQILLRDAVIEGSRRWQLLAAAISLGVVVVASVLVSDKSYERASTIVIPLTSTGLFVALAVGHHVNLTPRTFIGPAFVLITAGSSFHFGLHAHLPVEHPQILRFETLRPVIEFLKEEKEFFRVHWPNTLAQRMGDGVYELRAPIAAVFGVFNIDGYDQLRLRRHEQMFQNLPLDLALGFFNVKYALTNSSQAPALDTTGAPVFSGNGIDVHRLSAYLPRAFVVGEWSIVPDSEMPAALLAAGFDPLRRVILEKQPFATPFPTQSPFQGSVDIVSYRLQEIHMQVQASREGVLVLNEIYYPGWRAEVDGNEVEVILADAVLRGIPVPAGSHSVRVYFAPHSVKMGGLISMGSLLTASLVVLVSRMRHSRHIAGPGGHLLVARSGQ